MIFFNLRLRTLLRIIAPVKTGLFLSLKDTSSVSRNRNCLRVQGHASPTTHSSFTTSLTNSPLPSKNSDWNADPPPFTTVTSLDSEVIPQQRKSCQQLENQPNASQVETAGRQPRFCRVSVLTEKSSRPLFYIKENVSGTVCLEKMHTLEPPTA